MNLRTSTILFALFTISLFNSCKKKHEEAEPFSQLVFEDEFNGTSLDVTNTWFIETGNGCPNCGWGNGEKEYYTNRPENITVADGFLNIIARYEPNYNGSGSNFTSGRIITRNKKSWLYGKFEARMKLPAGTGMWPAFWMLPQPPNPYGGWPTSGEIDIMENRGDQITKVQGTLHYGNSWPNNKWDGSPSYLSTGNYTNSFHIFGIEWEPGQIRWYVDGKLFKTEKQDPNSLIPVSNNANKWPWDQDFFMILNLAVGGWFAGDPSDDAIINGNVNYTRTLQVDWVRAYKYK
jgi:beta-glucanase (GH16 family)